MKRSLLFSIPATQWHGKIHRLGRANQRGSAVAGQQPVPAANPQKHTQIYVRDWRLSEFSLRQGLLQRPLYPVASGAPDGRASPTQKGRDLPDMRRASGQQGRMGSLQVALSRIKTEDHPWRLYRVHGWGVRRLRRHIPTSRLRLPSSGHDGEGALSVEHDRQQIRCDHRVGGRKMRPSMRQLPPNEAFQRVASQVRALALGAA